MNLFGNNTLSISEQTGVSFLVDLSLDNISGVCNLGFTGINQNINFKFTNGKIFDPENKLIYTYNLNENIKLSGNINTSGYDYYINNYYLSNISSKNYGKFDRFYLNTSGCTGAVELYINGDKPNYKLDFNNFYYVRENITGFISGNQDLNFKIYSGDIISPSNSNFSIKTIPSFDQNISGDKYDIIVTPDFDTTKQLYLDKTGDFIFGLYTNFGKIFGVFDLKSQYLTTGYINYFNINKNSETFSNQPGQINTDSYILSVDFVSGNETGEYSVNKNLSFVFEYASGYIGKISQEINISTGVNTTLSGFISGSGYLSKSFFVTGSGINLLTNNIVTGEIYSDVNEFIYLNGFVINKIDVEVSGGISYNQTVSGYNSGINFGQALDLNSKGDVAIIGAPYSKFTSGLAYIFSGFNDNWTQIAELSGQKSGDYFGYSVASNASGNKFLIGAPNADSGSGAAYIYNLNNGSWNYQRITGSGLNSFLNIPFFGNSVALNRSGDIAIVAGINEHGSDGAIYIFSGNNLNYNIKQKISGDKDIKGKFGYSIAINNSGNVIAVSQPYENYGTAYIITGNNNEWGKCKKIYQENQTSGFGLSIDINQDGNSIIVGAPLSNKNSGLAFLFTGNGNDWNIAKTFSGDGQTYKFGTSVGINSTGNKVIIGGMNLINADLIGKSWIYTGNNNNWKKLNEFTGDYGFASSNVLNSTGNIYLIGDSFNDKATLVSDNFSILNATGQISGFVENGILYYQDNFTTNIDGIEYIGEYIDSIIATGISSGDYNFILTGLTDIAYEKTFTNTFNITTGYCYKDSSGNLIPTGNINFRNNNYITNGKYISGSVVSPNINQINISIEKTNFYDNYAMSGNLYITGKNLTNNLTTGVKIPVISTGITPNYPSNIMILIP